MTAPRLLCLLSLFVLQQATAQTANDNTASQAFAPTAPIPAWTRPVAIPEATDLAPDELSSGIWNLVFSKQINQLTDEVFTYNAIKVVNQSGVETASTVSVSYQPEYQSVVFHTLSVYRDGQKLDRLATQPIEILRRETDREMLVYNNDMEALLILDDLRPGDILEYAHTVSGSNPVEKGHFEWTVSTEWSVPIARQHFLLLWPREKPIGIKHQGKTIDLRSRDYDNHVEYEWDQYNTTPLHEDDYLPSWFLPWPYLEISSYQNWQQAARWGAALYRDDAPIKGELREIINDFRGFPSDTEQILAALRFVQDHIRYTSISIGEHNYKPYPLTDVLARRFGDCKDKSRLLCAILQALGYDATPALVNSSYGPILDQALPGPANFDHVITRLRFQGKTYWLDPTDSFQRGDLESLFATNYGFALPLADDTVALEWTGGANFERSKSIVFERFEELPDNQANLGVTSRYEGAAADSMRYSLNASNPAAYERNYLNHYASHFPSIKVAAPLRVEDDEINNHLVIHESYRIEEFLTNDGDGDDARYATFYASTLYGNYTDPGTRIRTMPLRQRHPINLEHTVEVLFHNDIWSFDDEIKSIENNGFRFEYSATSAPKRLSLRFVFNSLADVVPVAESADYIADVDKLDELLSYTIVNHGTAGAVDNDDEDGVPFYGHFVTAATAGVFSLPYALVLLLRPRRRLPPADEDTEQHALYGLGGWLILVGIGIALRPVFIGAYFFDPDLRFTFDVWRTLTHPDGEYFHPLNIVLLYGEPLLTAVHFNISIH